MRSRLLLPLLTFCIALFAQAFAVAADPAPLPGMHSISMSVADLYGSAAPAGDAVSMTIEVGDPNHDPVTNGHTTESNRLYEPGSSVPLSGWHTVIVDKPLYMEGQAAFRPGS